MTSGLTVENLSYAYGPKMALDGISLRIDPGRFCALLGPNGAGKSTLFNLLTRLFIAPSGQIMLDGFDLARHPRAALARLGVVFQQPTLDLDLTVRRNLLYLAALHGIGGREADRRAIAALDRLGMADRANELVRSLNGGHRRRMEIARALVHRPSVLLLDEPTVGLDASARVAITTHVHDLARDGMTVLWATHLTDEIEDADQVVVLHNGHVLAHDTAHAMRGAGSLRDVFLGLTAPDRADLT